MATFPAKTNYAAGDILTAAQMVDIGDQINALNGTRAGKNFAINGAFDFWQRNTSSASLGAYATADRWYQSGAGTVTFSRDTDVPTSSGFTYSAKWTTGAGSSFGEWFQALEEQDVNVLVGQKVTLSFYMKRNSTFSGQAYIEIQEGNTANTLTGGTWTNNTALRAIDTPGTTWQRYSCTGTITAGTKGIRIHISVGSSQASGAVLFVAGVQLELGGIATTFSRAGGTLAGELAACQRYYHRIGENSNYQKFGNGIATSATNARIVINHPVQMRIPPSSVLGGNLAAYDAAVQNAVTAVTLEQAGTLVTSIDCTSTGLTTSRATILMANNSLSAYLAFNAEL